MTLQNRVAPDGSLHAVGERGMFTGNRGILHDPVTRTLKGRRWTTKAWICCALDYRDTRRDVWGLNANTRQGRSVGWSELFFMDEVTALAAGHRPCFLCRREAAQSFVSAMGVASAPQCDQILHGERQLSARDKPGNTGTEPIETLPDGTVVEIDNQFHAIRGGHALPWSFGGYGQPEPLALLRHRLAKSFSGFAASIVTPPSTLKALRAGYSPAWHPAAIIAQ
ncbi:MAG: hypothetical protein WBO55_10720 [Rhizobiaceae bacterium]